ncbi:mechanosensitive ion channel [Paracoccus sp. 1_MG-2023]|uniref:mechanosensitive ion channel family protein n=1 Tax=unclassified Paracoccus (in: a-proteobacteria) TaxID=2688777 RepID=UPI001C07F8BD|nr:MULTISPECIES: mechanosensitive ion channel domain-containing protein [unclassified Paracoccus (in: a-proteobacteria)]MBU2958441.1 mechanosensitive ion channel family protein [Paracoccus sp. C2R09]MDO6668574.1 mechanosensitive ion channel [Paracoccus sp. 1_MG-2023]
MSILRTLLSACLAVLILAALPAQAQEQTPWYEIETLNEGLAPDDQAMDLQTPRSSLESFLAQASRGNWDAAAHALDLSGIDPADQPSEGRARALDFMHLLQRKIVVDWYDLPDRPDGLDSRLSPESPMAGMARKSILLWYVELGERPTPIRINRVKPADGDPVWVVSRQTVDDLPALGAAFGPSRLEMALPPALRSPAFWGLQWWEVLALPIGLAATLLAGWITQKLLSRGYNRNRRLAPDSILVAVRGPIVLLVMTLVLSTLTNRVFIFSGRIDTILSPLTIIGIVVSMLWLVVNVADALVARLVSFDGAELNAIGEGQERRRSVATKVSALRRFMLVVIAVIGTAIVLNEASVVQSLGLSLLASAGTLTLIAAFAARNILSNIMASLQISLNQSARIGDKILYQGYVCSVERVNFTFVQLRVWTGKRLVVPVVDFVAEPFENWTMQEHLTLFEVILRLDHRADIGPLRDEYHRILDDMDIHEPESRGVMVSDHDAFGQHVLFLVPSLDPNTGWVQSCEVREKLLAAAREIDCEATPLFPKMRALDDEIEASPRA